MTVCLRFNHRSYSGRSGGIMYCSQAGCREISGYWLMGEALKEDQRRTWQLNNPYLDAWEKHYGLPSSAP